MRVGIATDHGGFILKEELVGQLKAAGHEVVDFGAFRDEAADDYPDFVIPLAEAVALKKVDRGVAICGSGVGAALPSQSGGAALPAALGTLAVALALTGLLRRRRPARP